jgi:hypothetical protein
MRTRIRGDAIRDSEHVGVAPSPKGVEISMINRGGLNIHALKFIHLWH